MNKVNSPELIKRFGVRGYPSFVYVAASTGGKYSHKFSKNRTYENLLKWMHEQLHIGGATKIEDEVVFEENYDVV